VSVIKTLFPLEFNDSSLTGAGANHEGSETSEERSEQEQEQKRGASDGATVWASAVDRAVFLDYDRGEGSLVAARGRRDGKQTLSWSRHRPPRWASIHV
jgi:hypothetical protein